ncbi:MAG: hypothetical protein R3D80_15440 [Paracoccaceae bacterium]
MIGAQLRRSTGRRCSFCSRPAPLGWAEWQTIALAALLLLVVPEILKALRAGGRKAG